MRLTTEHMTQLAELGDYVDKHPTGFIVRSIEVDLNDSFPCSVTLTWSTADSRFVVDLGQFQ